MPLRRDSNIAVVRVPRVFYYATVSPVARTTDIAELPECIAVKVETCGFLAFAGKACEKRPSRKPTDEGSSAPWQSQGLPPDPKTSNGRE